MANKNYDNKELDKDIREKRPLKLNFGAGLTKIPGYYSIDCIPLGGIDLVLDLEKPLTELPDNSVEAIYSRHVLEHVKQLVPLMQEFWRIGKYGCEIKITVPHFSNTYAFSDPTHVRFFGLYTMNYFCREESQPSSRKVPSYYGDFDFTVEQIKIEFYMNTLVDKILGRFFQYIFNISFSTQEFYERRFSSIYHAWQITYLMRVKNNLL
jgi:hypothetical protein